MSATQVARVTLLALSSLLLSVRAPAQEDAAFLRRAAQLGLAEVAASRMALVKSRDASIKAFADAVLADHARLTQQLEALARDAGVDLPTGLSLRQKLELRVLRDGSDEKFDQRYADVFGVKAYERRIRLFEAAAAGAEDPDVKTFAQSALPWLRQRLASAKSLSATAGCAPRRRARAASTQYRPSGRA